MIELKSVTRVILNPTFVNAFRQIFSFFLPILPAFFMIVPRLRSKLSMMQARLPLLRHKFFNNNTFRQHSNGVVNVSRVNISCFQRSMTSTSSLTQLDTDTNNTSESSAPSSASTLQVSEIFKSVQGEGPFTGRPSIFLRLGICNLSCVWCDTPYTWLFTSSRLTKVTERAKAKDLSSSSSSPATSIPTTTRVYDKSKELKKYSSSEAISHILKLSDNGKVSNVVITGGEPLLHKKPLIPIVKTFLQHGLSIEFETNGTISPVGLPNDQSSRIHLNVSPKLANSSQPYESRIKYPVLHQCLNFPSSVLKFVVDTHSDLDEVLDIVNNTGIDRNRVYLMPQGTNAAEIEERGRWLVDICLQHGFHYSHRLHVELWGAKRGV